MDIVRTHCNTCFSDTKHTVLYEKSFKGEECEGGGFDVDSYQLVECNGCETIGLLFSHYSGSVAEANYTLQYPPKIIKKEPKWLYDLMVRDMLMNPYKSDFIREIYIAIRNNTPRLAVIGIRALLEQIMIENVGDNKTFKNNLDKFEEEGFISKVQRMAVEPLVEAGHASTHRGFKAKIEEIIYLLDVIENLVESIYINKEIISKIKVPPRST
ncbi:MAG: hypothetical protein WAqPseu_34820 [Shewanella algae]